MKKKFFFFINFFFNKLWVIHQLYSKKKNKIFKLNLKFKGDKKINNI